MRVEISRRAATDLDAIYARGVEEFGAEVAERTAAAFIAQIGRLGEYPYLGSAVPDRGDGMRRMRCGVHVIFYRQSGMRLVVARVLHERMDAGRPQRGRAVEGAERLKRADSRKAGRRAIVVALASTIDTSDRPALPAHLLLPCPVRCTADSAALPPAAGMGRTQVSNALSP